MSNNTYPGVIDELKEIKRALGRDPGAPWPETGEIDATYRRIFEKENRNGRSELNEAAKRACDLKKVHYCKRMTEQGNCMDSGKACIGVITCIKDGEKRTRTYRLGLELREYMRVDGVTDKTVLLKCFKKDN